MHGGIQTISSGGTTTGTTVSNGGTQIVSSGGTASSTTVANGGQEVVYTGATASGTNLHAGGTIDLASLAFASGGTATLDGNDLLTVSETAGSARCNCRAPTPASTCYLAADGGSGTVITEGTDRAVLLPRHADTDRPRRSHDRGHVGRR